MKKENNSQKPNVKMALAFSADGMPVHIDNAINGKACNSSCIGCGCPVIAKNRGKVAPHYSHDPKYYNPDLCNWSPETELHLMAKMVIAKNKGLRVPIGTIEPNYKDINFETVELEKRVGNRIPDIIAYSNGEKVLIEISVTHPCEPDKISEMKRSFANCLEIDLSGFQFEELALNWETVRDYIKQAPVKWLSVSPVGHIGHETYIHNMSLQRSLAFEVKSAWGELTKLKNEAEPIKRNHDNLVNKIKTLKASIERQSSKYSKQQSIMLKNKSELERLRTLDEESERFAIDTQNLTMKIQKSNERENNLDLRERSLDLREHYIREQQDELQTQELNAQLYNQRILETQQSAFKEKLEAEIESEKINIKQERLCLDKDRSNFDELVEKRAAEKIVEIERRLHSEAHIQKGKIIQQANGAKRRVYELISPLPLKLKTQFDKARSFTKPPYEIIKEVEDIALKLSK